MILSNIQMIILGALLLCTIGALAYKNFGNGKKD